LRSETIGRNAELPGSAVARQIHTLRARVRRSRHGPDPPSGPANRPHKRPRLPRGAQDTAKVDAAIDALQETADRRDIEGRADFDGRHVGLGLEDLDSLALGYAITVHKAQGSQFARVIIPVFGGHRTLDHSLIYTAITRGERQVVLVGHDEVARTAVEGAAHATRRQIGFPAMLDELLADPMSYGHSD